MAFFAAGESRLRYWEEEIPDNLRQPDDMVLLLAYDDWEKEIRAKPQKQEGFEYLDFISWGIRVVFSVKIFISPLFYRNI